MNPTVYVETSAVSYLSARAIATLSSLLTSS